MARGKVQGWCTAPYTYIDELQGIFYRIQLDQILEGNVSVGGPDRFERKLAQQYTERRSSILIGIDIYQYINYTSKSIQRMAGHSASLVTYWKTPVLCVL